MRHKLICIFSFLFCAFLLGEAISMRQIGAPWGVNRFNNTKYKNDISPRWYAQNPAEYSFSIYVPGMLLSCYPEKEVLSYSVDDGGNVYIKRVEEDSSTAKADTTIIKIVWSNIKHGYTEEKVPSIPSGSREYLIAGNRSLLCDIRYIKGWAIILLISFLFVFFLSFCLLLWRKGLSFSLHKTVGLLLLTAIKLMSFHIL